MVRGNANVGIRLARSVPQHQPPLNTHHYNHNVSPRNTGSTNNTSSSSSSSALSSSNMKQNAIAMTLRLLVLALTVVAMFIMTFNLSFAYSRLVHHHNQQQQQQQQQHRSNNYNGFSHFNDNNNDKTRKQQPKPLSKHQQQQQNLKTMDGDKDKLMNIPKNCAFIGSIQDMWNCYRPELLRHLKENLERLPLHCHPHKGIDAVNTTSWPWLNNNWTQLQSCLTFVRPMKNTTSIPIRIIHILGERHSGTKFVQRELQACFPRSSSSSSLNGNFTLRIHRDWLRSKHFFQPLVSNIVNITNNNDETASDSTQGHDVDYSQSFIVAVFRNPVDWTEAMRLKPYHAPHHMKGFVWDQVKKKEIIEPLPWQDFVTMPWTMPFNPDHDLGPEVLLSRNKKRNISSSYDTACRYGFGPRDIIPCLYNAKSNYIPSHRVVGFEPIYEMTRNIIIGQNDEEDDDGNKPRPPFDNILQLWAEKNWHLALELPLLIPNLGGYLPVRYEDLLQQGTQNTLIDRVAELLGITPSCTTPTGPQPELLSQRQKSMSKDYKSFIQSYFDSSQQEQEQQRRPHPTTKLLGY